MVESVEQSTLINDAIPVKYETCSRQPQSVVLYSITPLLQFRDLNWLFKRCQNVEESVNCLGTVYATQSIMSLINKLKEALKKYVSIH